MANINSYSDDTNILDSDRVLGFETVGGLQTKNYRFDTIADYVRDQVVLSDVTDVTSTELNILDGATLSTSELNILDGVTASTSEINILDGLTPTTAELNYVDGVTSSIQAQLDSKQASITGGASTIATSNLTTNRALVSDTNGKVAVSAVTSTELGYLDGVTSAIQSQIDGITEFEPSNTGSANQILERTSSGYQWADATGVSYTLPAATASTLGGVIVELSSDIDIDSDGKLTLGNLSANKITSGTLDRNRLPEIDHGLITSTEAGGDAADGYVLTSDGAGNTAWEAQSAAAGHHVQLNGVDLTDRTNIDFQSPFTATDDSTNDSIDIGLSLGASDIPNLATGKITSGTFPNERLSSDTPTDGQVLTYDADTDSMEWTNKTSAVVDFGDESGEVGEQYEGNYSGDYTFGGDITFSGISGGGTNKFLAIASDGSLSAATVNTNAVTIEEVRDEVNARPGLFKTDAPTGTGGMKLARVTSGIATGTLRLEPQTGDPDNTDFYANFGTLGTLHLVDDEYAIDIDLTAGTNITWHDGDTLGEWRVPDGGWTEIYGQTIPAIFSDIILWYYHYTNDELEEKIEQDLEIATATTLGGVKVADASQIDIDTDGFLTLESVDVDQIRADSSENGNFLRVDSSGNIEYAGGLDAGSSLNLTSSLQNKPSISFAHESNQVEQSSGGEINWTEFLNNLTSKFTYADIRTTVNNENSGDEWGSMTIAAHRGGDLHDGDPYSFILINENDNGKVRFRGTAPMFDGLHGGAGKVIGVDANGQTSVVDGGGSGGNADTIDDNNQTDNLSYWSGTKAQYDAINTKDTSRIYYITDSTPDGSFSDSEDRTITGAWIFTKDLDLQGGITYAKGATAPTRTSGETGLQFWSGTKAQYNALTKNDDTIYYVTDE